MTGTTYILTHPKHSISITFKYDLNGFLIAFEIDGEFNQEQHEWLLSKVPIKEVSIEGTYKSANFTIQKLPIDLSFERFWDEYDYKVGKKKQAQNIWNALSKADKLKAFLYIKPYNNHLRMNPGLGKAYPTTFLNQEYYNR